MDSCVKTISTHPVPAVKKTSKVASPRPTHSADRSFLTAHAHNSQHTNTALHSQISAFQDALLAPVPPISDGSNVPARGLDPSIVIAPIRFHLTLGVMALDAEPEPESHPNPADTSPPGPVVDVQKQETPEGSSSHSKHMARRRTVEMALELLRSLKPQIGSIISAKDDSRLDYENASLPAHKVAKSSPIDTSYELAVELDALDILRPVKAPKKLPKSTPAQASTTSISDSTIQASSDQRDSLSQTIPEKREIWADHLYLAPKETPALRQIYGEFNLLPLLCLTDSY
ncbi:hypothetical protein H0H87_004858 [Tephrocybe sp. NHM501043]|nr:hypothetical protein H0H87_004858 [Tephrocybe sp. NHM501043]